MTFTWAHTANTTTGNSCHGRGIAAFMLALLPAIPASAQSDGNLDYLVFEPVPIETSLSDGGLDVTELASLPAGAQAVSPSEFWIKSSLERTQAPVPDLSTDISEYEKNISDLEVQGGAYDPALAQAYFSLANIYQAQGDHEHALEYFDKALHNNRVNQGLFNLDQEKIIENKIKSLVAQGDLIEADREQEYLFSLKRRSFGSKSVELLPALNDYAEWNIFAFDARLSMNPAFDYAAQSRDYAEHVVSNSIGEEDFKTTRLMHAQTIYRTIIQILINNYGVTDQRLLDIERKLALTNYFFATNMDISSAAFSNGNNSALALSSSQGYYDMSRVSSNSMGYRHGREALERRLEYMEAMDGISPVELANARLELGDWMMIFKKRTAALELYELAYAEMQHAGVSQEVISGIFSPSLPVTIPTFIDKRYTRGALAIPDDQPLAYKGWFDVRIGVNRFGQTGRVEILDRSPQASEEIESRLFRYLKSSTAFRPRFADGALLTSDEVQARYYYSY